MTLTELRDALRKATGPSIALDVRLFLALQDKQIMVIDDASERFPRPHQYVSARSIWNDDWRHWESRTQVEGVARELDCPAYTASIDAAVTLVPEGWVYTINAFRDWADAYLMNEDQEIVRLRPGTHPATPALALCLARVEYEIAKAEVKRPPGISHPQEPYVGEQKT